MAPGTATPGRRAVASVTLDAVELTVTEAPARLDGKRAYATPLNLWKPWAVRTRARPPGRRSRDALDEAEPRLDWMDSMTNTFIPHLEQHDRLMSRHQVRRATRATLHLLRQAALLVIALFAMLGFAGCATTGATFRSGVGDSFPERPPYRAGSNVGVTSSTRVAILPVAYQRGASQADIFDPSSAPASPISALLAEMNAYVDSLTRAAGGTVAVRIAAPAGTPPDVRFGCVQDASDDCASPSEPGPAVRNFDTEQPRMRLSVGRPAPEWTAAARSALEQSGAQQSLVLTLEVGQYWITKTGWLNRKSIALGTGYSVPLPWLTSLESPVNVLQLTGALMDRDGLAVRIGAEGLLARRTPLVLSSMGAQALISDDDVQQLRSLRRDDLPGQPLVWRAALRRLVSDLTAQPALAW